MPRTQYYNQRPNPDFDAFSATPAEIRAEFAKRLQSARLAKHMTQSELSRLAGIGRDNVSHYERGRSLPGVKFSKQLADALGVEVNWLVPRGGAKSVDQNLSKFSVEQIDDNHVRLRVNQMVTWDKFLKITEILKSGD